MRETATTVAVLAGLVLVAWFFDNAPLWVSLPAAVLAMAWVGARERRHS